MLQLEYENKITEVCDCMMGSIVNAALYYHLDYAYLYKGIWVFQFAKSNNEKSCFWERLSTPELVNSHKQIELYHGLRLEHCALGDSEEFLSVVERELQNKNPVAIGFDAYYCEWSGVYHKHSLLHFFLLVGLDRENGTVLCADPYFAKSLHICPIEELLLGTSEYYLFRVVAPVQGQENWKQDVRLCAEQKLQDGVFEQMQAMKDELLSSQLFAEEIRRQNDQYSFELFYQMKYISHSRANHAEFLRYVAEHIGGEAQALIQSAELLEQAAMRWKQTGLGFTRLAYITDEQKIKKQIIGIGDRVTQCIELEREAAEQILKITE